MRKLSYLARYFGICSVCIISTCPVLGSVPSQLSGQYCIRYHYKGFIEPDRKNLEGEITLASDGEHFLLRAEQVHGAKQRTLLFLKKGLAVSIQGTPKEPVVEMTRGLNPAWRWDYALPLLPVNFPIWRPFRDYEYRASEKSAVSDVPFMVSSGGPDTPVYRHSTLSEVSESRFEPSEIVVAFDKDPEERWKLTEYVDTAVGVRLPKHLMYSAPGKPGVDSTVEVKFELLGATSKGIAPSAFVPETYIGIGVNAVDLRNPVHQLMMYDPKQGSFTKQADGSGKFEAIPEVPNDRANRTIWIAVGALLGAALSAAFLAIRGKRSAAQT